MRFAKQRLRKTLSNEMKKALEEAFAKHRYPPIAELDKLATRFGQDVGTLRIWFYNRRANNPKR
ncbi:homeobox domain protein [Opisthorchis viverrini]|uniref:Homeobox domain protein n=1 Tax=Opisthorchis viverrini TaxID=6198 RepID=A0A1S8X896_OPIVI|nr:homeobox domain protein [Opisthorchis viverrini]